MKTPNDCILCHGTGWYTEHASAAGCAVTFERPCPRCNPAAYAAWAMEQFELSQDTRPAHVTLTS